MKIRSSRLLQLMCVLLLSVRLQAQPVFDLKDNFDQKIIPEKVGRGLCMVNNGILTTKGAYTAFGESNWRNYEITFKAKTPDSEQVQIWAGFRSEDRNDRYIVGLRGGESNDLYLARLGYMGTDEFLALRPLDFLPKTGQWYQFRIDVCGNRIRIFINNEPIPRIDVTDKNSKLLPRGKVVLGGGWLTTEYEQLRIQSLSEKYLEHVPVQEFARSESAAEKESKRKHERSQYRAIDVCKISKTRTEISLDGNWLFMPSYQLSDKDKAVSPLVNDEDWHVMRVPDFWNPIRIWLHGETFEGHEKGVSDVYYRKETQRCEAYTFNYRRTKIAWYRQWIDLPRNIKGKDLELDFDAVSKVAEVWINGKKAGNHIGMFGEFDIDGTKFFKPGRNLVVVKVIRDYVKNIADANKVVNVAVTVPVTNKMLKELAHGFYDDDPAGIWQPVKLVITNPVKITDVFIKPGLQSAGFNVTVKNTTKRSKRFDVRTSIVSCQTNLSLYKGTPLKKVQLAPGEEHTFVFSLSDLNPRLWSPAHPNLYNFSFELTDRGKALDDTEICSGFRTFESKNGFLYLNGHRYWLRGADQTPFALAPNNQKLADKFFHLMKAGNMEVTRTHTTPYNELWMDAADRDGIGISFEGTWPWLMIGSSMPDQQLIKLWADEFLSLVKKYRNHPSLLLWTVNNEMKFYDNDPDLDRAKKKMKIISDVVKRMRKIDPTRPICFDSNYHRNVAKFGKDFFKTIDDGDVDDIHYYPNWYNSTLFRQFNGEFQKQHKNAGRPLISQEMSTGYPNNETGHATRFYTIMHQNPQSLIGNMAYEFSNPTCFLKVHSFITGEVAEALRRTNDQASGILHFALITWFRNVYDPDRIEPYPAYYAMKRALQPVLVSAELWGRHFYAGEDLPVRVCIVNDREDYSNLPASKLEWNLVDGKGRSFASGTSKVGPVKYYGRKWILPEIHIPGDISAEKIAGKLKLSLIIGGKKVSENEYNLVFAKKTWSRLAGQDHKKIVVVDFSQMSREFDFLGIDYERASSVRAALQIKANEYVFAGLDPGKNCSAEELQGIHTLISSGGKVLLLDSEKAAQDIFPAYITGWFKPDEGGISNMEIPESTVFKGIDPLELRYFNNNKREIPIVCRLAFRINRDKHVIPLASYMNIHSYISGDMEQREKYVKSIKGFPIIEINDHGTAIISTMELNKSLTDPIAGRLLSNMVKSLIHLVPNE